MSPCPHVPMSPCPHVPMSPCPHVPMSPCPHAPMSPCPPVPPPVCFSRQRAFAPLLGNSRGARMDMQKLVKPFRIDDGKKFRLKDISPKDTRGIKSKQRALELLQQGVDRRRQRE